MQCENYMIISRINVCSKQTFFWHLLDPTSFSRVFSSPSLEVQLFENNNFLNYLLYI